MYAKVHFSLTFINLLLKRKKKYVKHVNAHFNGNLTIKHERFAFKITIVQLRVFNRTEGKGVGLIYSNRTHFFDFKLMIII